MIETFAGSRRARKLKIGKNCEVSDGRGRGDLVERVGETFEARFPVDRASLTSAEESAEET
jgi:hypothetical protein